MIDDTFPIHFESLYPSSSRESEIKQIIDLIKSGSSVQITGLPGVGRSNLLQLLSYNHNVREKHLGENQKWFHFVFLNCAEIKDRKLSDVTKFIFLSLADSLRDRGLQEEHDKLHAIFNQHHALADEVVLFAGLKEAMDYLTLEKQFTIVFMFDRFEEYIPSVTQNFFSHLKILRDRAKYRFGVIFSTPRPLEDLVELPILSDFYEYIQGHVIQLSLFDKSSMEFRIAYLEKSKERTIDKKIVGSIFALTAGHGKLTLLAVEEVFNDPVIASGAKQSQVKKIAASPLAPRNDELKDFLLNQKSIQRSLFEIWNFLTPEEQTKLNVILASETRPESGKDAGQASMTTIEQSNNVTMAAHIPLLSEFVKTKSLMEEIKQEKIEFNTTNNTITKGHVVLSDNLTSLEFKLLKYLITTSGKTLERDEVIQAVWETKSTAGVTDQAVDQLVFRLRKKIEEDPNNPQHLVTIKGRGFKLTP